MTESGGTQAPDPAWPSPDPGTAYVAAPVTPPAVVAPSPVAAPGYRQVYLPQSPVPTYAPARLPQHAFAAPAPVADRRSRGVAAVVLASVAVVTATVVATTVVLPNVLGVATAHRAVAGSSATPGAVAAGSLRDREVTDPTTRAAAIDAVLAARGKAVTTDDAKAWKRSQTANATAPAFARLAVLPITVWRYDVTPVDGASTSDEVIVKARVHTRYDIDTADAIVREIVTLRHGTGGWKVASETNDGARLQPWDLGTLSIVRGSRSLVIGIDQRASVLRRYASIADSVTPDVTAVWGTDWNAHPVLIVPKTVGQLGRALDETEKFLDDFAAVTTGESGSATPTKSVYRVWTNTPGLSDVSQLGREIVLRHEIAHVATAAPGTPSVPLWLEEGFAEYVGYSTTSVPERSAWSELVTAVRKGEAPTSLPDEDAFHSGAIDLAYESSDLACRLIADTYGRAGLVKLYRLVRSGTGSEDANLEAALTTVTGSGTAAFVRKWRARMASLR